MNCFLENFGQAEFGRIETQTELDAAFTEIQDYLNLHAYAAGQQPPDYTASRRKFAALLEQKRLSATVLKADGWIISAYFGQLAEQGKMELLLRSGSPFYEIYQPYKLHSRILAELDLTIDDAKNQADVISFATATENAPSVKKQKNAFLNSSREKFQILLQKLKNYRLYDARRKVNSLEREFLGKKREMNVYRLDFQIYAGQQMPEVPIIKYNSVSDLLKYEQTELWQPSVPEFRKKILELMQNGAESYTVAEDDLLIYSLWQCRNLKYSAVEIQHDFQLPENSIFSFDAYTHPRAREKKLHQRVTTEINIYICQRGKYRYGYTAILPDNAISIHVIKKIGYEHHSTVSF